MHPHNIALALADARVADLQRAATHSTATVPPRRHRRHRRALALLGLAAAAALAALAPTGALAQPTHDAATPANAHVDGAPAPKPAQDLRALAKTSSLAGTPARPRQDLRSPDARDAAAQAHQHYYSSYGADSSSGRKQDLRSPDARDAAIRPMRIIETPASGFRWADAAIGAAASFGLVLVIAGGSIVLTRRRRPLPAALVD